MRTMNSKLFLSLLLASAMALQVQAQTHHSVGASWSFMGFNSTYSKNSEKQTFGTLGLQYEYRFSELIALNANLGWAHSWFGPDANPQYAYPLKDNAILVLAGCDVKWLRRGSLELHSGIAGGMDIRVQQNKRGTYTTMGLAGQFDAVGIRLNRNHAYLDLSTGWGSMGCIRLGAGYRF